MKDPVTGNAMPPGFTTDDFTKSDPTPLAVTLGYSKVEWTLIGIGDSVTPPTTNLVPHTIALSHPFNDERVVTMFGTDSLDGLGF